MNFGKAIALSFVVFAAFIGVLVGVCMNQNMSLVSADYYQREINHGRKMAMAKAALHLDSRPVIWFGHDQVAVSWDRLKQMDHAHLWLYRPSDQHLDKNFEWHQSAADTVALQVTDIKPGLWRASLTWTMDGRDYLMEQVIIR